MSGGCCRSLQRLRRGWILFRGIGREREHRNGELRRLGMDLSGRSGGLVLGGICRGLESWGFDS